MKKNDFLPDIFRFSHDYALYLHNCLAEFIVYGEKMKLFDVKMSFDTKEQSEGFSGLVGEEIFQWLEQHNKNKVLGELLLKSLYPALLADLCQFVDEALYCSIRGRLTVTYALLRKPLRDNLFYLEWLLADPESLLNTLYYHPPSEMALEKFTTREKAIPIIQAAINRTASSTMFDAEFIYDSRYNRAVEFSFEQLWNKALHLVTTRKYIETEQQNLNFIFSDDEARWGQWYHIYTTLPYLLYYTAEIADSLMILIMGDTRPNFYEALLHRSIGLLLWGQEINKIKNLDSDELEFNEVIKDYNFECVHCHMIIIPNSESLKYLFEKEILKCNHCHRKNTISDLIRLTAQ